MKRTQPKPSQMHPCPKCGQLTANLQWCSAACRRGDSPPPQPYKCPGCGHKTVAANGRCRSCQAEARRQEFTRPCAVCGELYTPAKGTQVYCSPGCRDESQFTRRIARNLARTAAGYWRCQRQTGAVFAVNVAADGLPIGRWEAPCQP